ncbi:12753_t:CDS:2 [Dentiscutata heterogama]|uniref:12753_t:CDS:1 n=1 Tax=Dentiscutata heterogama TaxID=1316150 RepID=A0ACA9LJ36_9GLOM|nr:12753_t:CDS:2 [Dentiscutata heterogama]
MAITRLKLKKSFRATLSMKKLANAEKMYSFTATGPTTRRLYKYLKAHENSSIVWAAYACINENIKLYGVTYDPQNKTVSARKFDVKKNITEIIYNGRKRISGIGMVYNIRTRIYESDQSQTDSPFAAEQVSVPIVGTYYLRNTKFF